ncbi:flavodoxin domain-containing protein [Nocardia huaxiensis]|uniref:Flavodoxin domain-containing protein n=1 Tax=Nocardia huaxiensis TaxID=2755382 RepID=A0A7D6Z9W2_9NOCA|nr:flavodoxin domain-containing protein [Nocardia huaxiensis]QLY28598.1 flavodoxin domain-containing protein [Nocardia huaxiensis]UFS97931.1 flavodoxin domain-containing protein [Nocardia huaxiensis]
MDTHETPRIAVVYATAQGATREIAEYLGASLAGRGATVEVADVEHAPELSRFDVVVLGSAIHNMDFLPEATEFVRSHHDALTVRKVWLFGVGLGPALTGPLGRYLGRRVPKRIARLRDAIAPREYRTFAGHYERAGVSLEARALYRVLGGTRYGDLRDWTAIELWADSIAQALHLPKAHTVPTHP